MKLVNYSDSDEEEPHVKKRIKTDNIIVNNNLSSAGNKEDDDEDDDDEEIKDINKEPIDFFNLNPENPFITEEKESDTEQDLEPIDISLLSYEEYAKQFKPVNQIESNEDLPIELNDIPDYAAHVKRHGSSAIKVISQHDQMSDYEKYAKTRAALQEAQKNKKPNQFAMSRAAYGNLRNNNIMFLAYQANEHENELLEAQVHRKEMQKETRKTYGF